MELTRVHRHRYIIEDPTRLGCVAAAAALFFAQEVPFWMTLAVVAVTQLAPIMMAIRALDQGWSHRWGSRVHPSLYASNLAMDFTLLSACTVTGALLLARHFNSVEVVKPLALLTVAVCLLPDVGLCRWLLSRDPAEASRELRHGSILRDPVMLGVLLATGVGCVLDRVSLEYFLLSMIFLQFNALLVLVDKYLPEIESRAHAGWRAFVLEREGRRLWLTLAPLVLLPVRLGLGDRVAWVYAAGVAAAIVIPELYRVLLGLLTGSAPLLKVAPPPAPATYIVLPK
jgi:hypothetical protein